MIQAALDPTKNNLAGPVGKQRIQALDVTRGVSILGILAVNADGYAAPIAASLKPASWPFPNTGVTAFAYWFMDAFFHDKFMTLFSMLFGISVFLVGGERCDKRKSRLLWRRLTALFLFAMLHGFGIWWGDVLSLYACSGVLMTFCRSWPSRRLLFAGIPLYLVMVLPSVPWTFSAHSRPELRQTALPRTSSEPTLLARKAKIDATIREASGSWTGAYKVNTAAYIHQLRGLPMQIPMNLSLMMIGLSLFKSGFFSAKSSTGQYRVTALIGGLALSIICPLLWLTDVKARPPSGEQVWIELLSPLVSLLYVSCLTLLLRGSAKRLFSPLASVGRMAFTNYLTQSMIMTSIFYGGRGALMGQVNRAGLWGLVVIVWLLQLVWSSFWLSRFEMGPFEWLWRCLTYGQRVPIVKPTALQSARHFQ